MHNWGFKESFEFCYKEILRKNYKHDLSIYLFVEKIAQNILVQMLKKRPGYWNAASNCRSLKSDFGSLKLS